MAVPVVVREHYLKAIGALIERYKRELGAAGIDYQLLTTDQPLELALLAYLSTRATDVLMSFLSPLFLVGAAAAAVPIVLHLLKREPEARVKFAAVKLLQHAPVETRAEAPSARAAAAGAARGRAPVAGARVCAAVSEFERVPRRRRA